MKGQEDPCNSLLHRAHDKNNTSGNRVASDSFSPHAAYLLPPPPMHQPRHTLVVCTVTYTAPRGCTRVVHTRGENPSRSRKPHHDDIRCVIASGTPIQLLCNIQFLSSINATPASRVAPRRSCLQARSSEEAPPSASKNATLPLRVHRHRRRGAGWVNDASASG